MSEGQHIIGGPVDFGPLPTEPPPPPPLTAGRDKREVTIQFDRPQGGIVGHVGGLLTADEHEALKLTGALWNLVGRIVGDGRSRPGDLAEISIHIHNLQHAILAQAAARAYPDRYRLLGGTITVTETRCPG